MNPEAPSTRQPNPDTGSIRRESWFATFTFLDAGGAISSSQLQYLVASFAKLWRRARKPFQQA
jgi:hypothetical protein